MQETKVFLEELVTIFENGGFVMPPLAVMAVLLWMGVGYRAVTLRRGSPLPVRVLVKKAREGSITRPQGFVDAAAVIAVATAKKSPAHLYRHLDEELFFLTGRMNRFKTLVRTIIIIAPLAGLLGTVSGMIEMFESLGSQTFYSQSGGVANGISQALLTTQFGLMIAIPGMIVGRLMDRREESMEREIEQVKELLTGTETSGVIPA